MKSVVLKTEIPGPKSRALMELVHQHTPKSVGHGTPLGIASAKGATVTDLDGNTFLDFSGGIGTLNMGHCPPAVVEAIQQQAGEYLHLCFQVLAYPSYVELAAKLNAITPGKHAKKTVLFNSGAEVTENAVPVDIPGIADRLAIGIRRSQTSETQSVSLHHRVRTTRIGNRRCVGINCQCRGI